MKQSLRILSLFLSTSIAAAQGLQSGSGTTTRYWDCCKPSCAWPGKGQLAGVVQTCDANDKPLSDTNEQSGCAGGGAYMCSDQSPWAVSDDLAYGFAAVTASSPNCCSCYQLTFTSSVIAGKKMIVQATNTGNDVSNAQFDIAMPGGGFGQFDGCSTEWGATDAVWGQRYGGPTTNTCPQFPTALQPGCGFRWGWMQGADNPTVDYEVVDCPAAIVAKSGCGVGSGKTPTSPSSPSSSSSSSSASSPAAAAPVASSSSAPATAPSAGIVVDQGSVHITPPLSSGDEEEETKSETGNTSGAENILEPPSPVSASSPSSTAPGSSGNGKKAHWHGKWHGDKGTMGRYRYHPRPKPASKDAEVSPPASSPEEKATVPEESGDAAGDARPDCKVQYIRVKG